MDKRIVKSEQAMKEAFIRLMKCKDPDKITVIQLCQEAKVNRSTFYARYGYKDALIYAILKDCIEDICLPAKQLMQAYTEQEGISRDGIAEYINRFVNNQIINIFCNCEKSTVYCRQMIELHVAVTLSQKENPHLFYPAYFQNTGVISLVLKWIKDGKQTPLKEVTEIVYQFSRTMYLMNHKDV